MGLRAGTIPIGGGENKLLIGGDIIVEVGGLNVYVNRAGRQRIIDYIAAIPPGDDLTLTVIRAGEKLTLRAPKH
jgi:serine protease Do